jgi:hypothetical protein
MGKICHLSAAIILSCFFSIKAISSTSQSSKVPGMYMPAFAWNFIYAFGNGPISGLSWSGNYLYISSGSYVVYSANGYAFLTQSTPVYCNAVDNANTYVQIFIANTSNVSYYDFQEYLP